MNQWLMARPPPRQWLFKKLIQRAVLKGDEHFMSVRYAANPLLLPDRWGFIYSIHRLGSANGRRQDSGPDSGAVIVGEHSHLSNFVSEHGQADPSRQVVLITQINKLPST